MLQTSLNSKINIKDQQENRNKNPLFRAAKCPASQPNTEVSVYVRKSSTRLIFMEPHPTSMRNQMFLPASGMLNALPHTLKSIRGANFTELDKCTGMHVSRVGVDLPDVTVHLDKAAIHLTEKIREMEDKPVTDTFAAVHYKGKEWPDGYMHIPKEVETLRLFRVRYRLLRKRKHRCTLCRSLSRNSGHTFRISTNLGWTFGPH